MKILSSIKSKIYAWYIKERKLLVVSLLCGAIITVGAGVHTKNYSQKIISGIASQVIRFHVLANSDESADQNLKLLVKEKVLAQYSPVLNASSSIKETRQTIENNLAAIEALAQTIVYEQGFSYSVKATLAKDNFPTKQYGDITLPAGNYETLRIEIGESKGQNWWCVMFPPLCYVDVTKNEIDPATKEILRSMMTEEEYMLMDNNMRQNNDIVKIKFKIVEWWQNQNGEPEAEDIILVQSIKGEIGEGSF